MFPAELCAPAQYNFMLFPAQYRNPSAPALPSTTTDIYYIWRFLPAFSAHILISIRALFFLVNVAYLIQGIIRRHKWIMQDGKLWKCKWGRGCWVQSLVASLVGFLLAFFLNCLLTTPVPIVECAQLMKEPGEWRFFFQARWASISGWHKATEAWHVHSRLALPSLSLSEYWSLYFP